MEPSHLPQSNVATPPSLGVALAASLASPDALLPLPYPPQRTEDVIRMLTEPARTHLTFPAKPVPVAVGSILAAALDSRWHSYRKQLRRCQEQFSEEAVHELRVATVSFQPTAVFAPNSSNYVTLAFRSEERRVGQAIRS